MPFKLERDGLYYTKKLRAGDFMVSIQCSDHHYCEPRVLIENPNSYKKYEVAIFDKRGNWVLPRKELTRFKWSELFEEGETTAVAGWVPKGTVQRIIKDLEELKKGAKKDECGDNKKR